MTKSKSVRAGEDMALTKAAVGAWHKRATACRLVQPFEIRAAAAAPKQRRPSRHKLEADAAVARSTSQPPLTRSGSVSLLHGYEIRQTHRQTHRRGTQILGEAGAAAEKET